MDKTQIHEINLTLSGDTDLEDLKNLERVLAQVQIPGMMPDSMGVNRQKHEPYSETKITGELRSRLHFGLPITRKKAIKYRGEIYAGPESSLAFDFHSSISKKNMQKIFAWSDDMATAYPPEAGTLTIIPKYLDESIADSKFEQAFRCGFLRGGTHARYGPMLGMYSWLGKNHVDTIGLHNLKATPMLTVEEKDWGGVRLVLGETQRPWEMDRDTWVASWHVAMDHLRQFHVFAYSVVEDDRVRVYRGKHCKTPRPDGKVRDISSYLSPEDRPTTVNERNKPIRGNNICIWKSNSQFSKDMAGSIYGQLAEGDAKPEQIDASEQIGQFVAYITKRFPPLEQDPESTIWASSFTTSDWHCMVSMSYEHEDYPDILMDIQDNCEDMGLTIYDSDSGAIFTV